MKLWSKAAAAGAVALSLLAGPTANAAADAKPAPAPAAKAAKPGTAVAAVDPRPLRIGIDGRYPPFSEIAKGGKLVGFDVEIARALCEQIKAKCELAVMSNWAEVIPSIEAAKYDAVVASMSITDERLKRIDFTRSYYHVPVKFVARKGADIGQGLAALRGKRVGVQAATTHEDYLRRRFAHESDLRAYETLPAALDDLAKGRLDLVMGDSLALQTGFLASPEGQGFGFAGPAFSDPRFFGKGAGIALPKSNAALKDELNQALAAIRANGAYQKIAGKYFGFDIYGGE